ncbi:hypothetical protein [Mycobacteroides abscessus]|uniref:Gp37-like protein n=1 Tax=Mycobacteroides abscessus TaxID=36809 RepID=UPI001F1ECBFE|nr:hypothetical protein [Mycobacteroides abscessus]
MPSLSGVLSDAEFAQIEQQLIDRQWAYLTRPIKQPLIRIWDKKMDFTASIVLQESWDCEEIAHDDGQANVEIVGKDNDWLRDIVLYKTKPSEDLHITIDPDPDKPHDWRNRWGGKVVTIEDDEQRGQPNKTVLRCISNRRHLSHFYLAATPIFPPAVQPLRMFLWGGPAVTAMSTALWINLARVYSLNSFSPIPRNIFAPETWLENLSPLNWPVQVMPVNAVLDQSRWCTIAARWRDAKSVFTPIMKDCGVICHAYTWLKGDPAPYTMFGPELAELLKPKRSCVILSFEDQSGVSGPTGTAFDGLLNLIAVTGDDMITEALLPIDGDGDGETDPFIRKILGVAPKRPPWVYRDVGYGGVQARKMVVHKCQATDIIVGGKSPAWVNQAITFAIRYGLSQLAQVINYGVGAYQQPLTEGLDNLYQGQLDDTLLAFMIYTDPIRSMNAGPYAFREHYQQGSGSAFTVNSVQDARAGWFATRPYTSIKFDVGDGAPFVIGEDIRLGSRVSAEIRGIVYTDQIMAIKRQGDRKTSGRPMLSFGDDSREEDPMAQGFATIANLTNFAATIAGSGDMF